MLPFDDIKKYLPQYLSAKSTNQLFEDLDAFPENLDKLYSDKVLKEESVFQGDGMFELPMIFLPSTEIKNEKGIVLSNTCDINPKNERPIEPRMVYAPLLSLAKYENLLRSKGVGEKDLSDHVQSIKKQRISQLIFLPKGQRLEDDSIALLDRLNNFVTIQDQKAIPDLKMFSLSDYGFYVFLIKLSIHFMRIREEYDRN